jgi:DNA-binding transcriptional regulator YdaS (Cro superfamily)
MSHSAIVKAVEIAGGQKALASKIGVTQQAVSYWLKAKNLRLPGERALAIEAATGVSRHDLRPDLYPRDSAA